jgi:hypothetical protein
MTVAAGVTQLVIFVCQKANSGFCKLTMRQKTNVYMAMSLEMKYGLNIEAAMKPNGRNKADFMGETSSSRRSCV